MPEGTTNALVADFFMQSNARANFRLMQTIMPTKIRGFIEMRKASIRFFLALLLGFQMASTVFTANATDVRRLPYQPPERSREELYQDIFISLLLPTIQKEVDKYYSKYLTQPPMVAPYTVYVLSAERPNGYRTFAFDLKLRVDSYIGPHNSVGLDVMTVTVGGDGDVAVKGFEHIKSYELPPNYQNIIKKGYTNPIP